MCRLSLLVPEVLIEGARKLSCGWLLTGNLVCGSVTRAALPKCSCTLWVWFLLCLRLSATLLVMTL